MALEAATVQTTSKQTSFAVSAQYVPSRLVFAATFDPAKTTLATLEEIQLFSAEDAGAQGGFGHPGHRLAQAAWAKHGGDIPTFVIWQDEVAGAQATGDVLFSGTALTENVTLAGYINEIRIPVTLLKGDLPAAIAAKLIVAYDAVLQSEGVPTTHLVNVTPEQVDFTAKSTSTYGNGIKLNFAIGAGETIPPELTIVVTPMTGGTGIPDIQEALDVLGTVDNQNQNHNTDFNHSYGKDSTTWDDISTYNGAGLDPIGNWSGEVHKPMLCMKGDNDPGTQGFTDATVFTEARKAYDRTNGLVSVPGSPNHEDDIGVFIASEISLKRNKRPSGSTVRKNILTWLIPGAQADRWSDDSSLRNQALNKGLGSTKVVSNKVQLLDTVTAFHPDNINPDSNSYRAFRSVGILMNMISTTQTRFEANDLKDKAIVADAGITLGDLAIDIVYIRGVYISLAKLFAEEAWIFSLPFTLQKLKEVDSVTLLTGANGFIGLFKTIISGEPSIFKTEIQTDNSVKVLADR